MRGDVWDEPVLSCYCQDQNGEWDLTSINLGECLPVLPTYWSTPMI